MTDPWVVVLQETGAVFGPFDTEKQAEEFALYLRDEVDPAYVRPLCSPVDSLLSWRREIAVPSFERALREVPRG